LIVEIGDGKERCVWGWGISVGACTMLWMLNDNSFRWFRVIVSCDTDLTLKPCIQIEDEVEDCYVEAH
jgi:hypothetical protein